MIKVLYGRTPETSKELKAVETEKEAFEIVSKDIEKNKFESYYLRCWSYEGVTTIDYGSHVNFYYIKQ